MSGHAQCWRHYHHIQEKTGSDICRRIELMEGNRNPDMTHLPYEVHSQACALPMFMMFEGSG